MPLQIRPKNVRSLVLRMVMVLSTLAMAACDSGRAIPTSSTALIGTKTIFLRDGKSLAAEITDVTEKFVTSQISKLDGTPLNRQIHYRGLYRMGVLGGKNRQWELDFNEDQLESLFPLRTGKKTSIAGSINFIDYGQSYDYVANFSVIGEKTIDLPDGLHKVMLVEVFSEYLLPDGTYEEKEILYFDPAMSLILKKITWAEHKKQYWRVQSVERPGEAAQTPPTRQRRSGTVMI